MASLEHLWNEYYSIDHHNFTGGQDLNRFILQYFDEYYMKIKCITKNETTPDLAVKFSAFLLQLIFILMRV